MTFRPPRTIALLAVAAVTLGLVQTQTPATAAAAQSSVTAPGWLQVHGNALVGANGAPVQLTGVGRSGTEYACAGGWGFSDGPVDDASVSAMTGWGINAVRVPLNEDCWLGISGAPATWSGSTYRAAVVNEVSTLLAHGMAVVLDLHFTAPGAYLARSQAPMPDADHSPAFWAGVASTFKATPGIAYELFNEPHDVS